MLEGRVNVVERVAFVATVIFAGATFWFAPRLPMLDLPQHAAQVAIWRDLLTDTSKWQSLLYVNYFTPYLGGYGVSLLLSFFLPISAALKVPLVIAYFGFVTACVALRSRLGGDARLDWLFIPGFFGYAYALGLYTFLFAAPLGVLFILLAHRYAIQPTPVSGAVLCLADLALFFCHGLVFLFANVIGGLFLLLKVRPWRRLFLVAIPYAVVGSLCLVYALVPMGRGLAPSGQALDIVWFWDLTRLNFLLFSMGWPVGGSLSADWRFGSLVFLMLASPLLLGARFNRRDAAAFVPFLVTCLVWLLVPVGVFNTWLIYQRFAIFLLPAYALMFTAPDAARPASILARLWLPLLCWVFLAVHTERLLAFARESEHFEDVLAVAMPGQRALGLIFDSASPAAGNLVVYHHFPLWYQAEKQGFVDFNFAGYLPQVVRYRPDREPAAFKTPVWTWRLPNDFDWTRDEAIYRYFFVRRVSPLPSNFFPAGHCAPVLVKTSGSWSLFENVNCYRPD